jgi:uncharacterized membrane protein
MSYLAIFILWLHVLAAITWIGGMIFTLATLVPNLKTPLSIEQLRLFQNAQTRFHFLAARAAEIIVLTGIFNVLIRGYYSQFQYSPAYMWILTLKIILLGVMIAIRVISSRTTVSKISDFLLTLPPSKQFTDQIPESIMQLQRRSQYFLLINTVLGMIVLFLALMLRNF